MKTALIDSIDVISERDGNILVVHAMYRTHTSKEDELDAFFAIQVDLNRSYIYPPDDLENYYRFGVWNEITEDQTGSYINQIEKLFSENDIREKIVKPLLEQPFHSVSFKEGL